MIGTIAGLWRYPVKSMAGEAAEELYLGFGGVYGDRLFAFTGEGRPAVFHVFHRAAESGDGAVPSAFS